MKALILGTIILYSGTAIPQEVELRCNETHCAVSKDDLRLIVQYIRKLEAECSAKTI